MFGIATGAAGAVQTRQGIDVLGMVRGTVKPREKLIGYYGDPATSAFKIMVRTRQWKYIFIANGGREQLFDMRTDPQELRNLAADEPEVVRTLREEAVAACRTPGAAATLNGDDLRRSLFAKCQPGGFWPSRLALIRPLSRRDGFPTTARRCLARTPRGHNELPRLIIRSSCQWS